MLQVIVSSIKLFLFEQTYVLIINITVFIPLKIFNYLYLLPLPQSTPLV